MVVNTSGAGASLIYNINFNETGPTFNTGNGSGTGTLTSYSATYGGGAATDYHSSYVHGLTGSMGDYSFDNTGANKMGGNSVSPGQGAGAVIVQGSSALYNMKSFTVMGWYNASTAPTTGSNARLLSAGNVNVYFGTSGLMLNIVGATASGSVGSMDTGYFTSGTWTFFAISYDSTLSSNNVVYYQSTSAGTVSQLGAATLNNGAVKTSGTTLDLSIGNTITSTGYLDRPFQGYLDDFAVYGSSMDNSGALALSDIQSIVNSNLSAVPETSFPWHFGIGVGLIALFSRRRWWGAISAVQL